MASPLFKKILTSVFCMFVLGLKIGFSQTVEDFTVTDTDGVTHSLYADYLDEGKTVVIKIFWAGCPPCNAIATDVQALYEKWDEGAGQVEFIELGDKSFEDDSHAIAYKARHGITFVTVSPQGNSIEALEQFSYSGTPTFIVVAPDRSMIFDPWPLDDVDAAIATTVNASAPDCPTSDVVINTMADIANYRSQYSNCTNFDGNITVAGDITNLLGFENLKSIQGTLEISSDFLLSLSDLSNLESVSNAIKIKDCDNLTALTGLERLNRLSSSIELTNLEKLSSLDGLKNLQELDGDLIIENCDALQSLEGLNNLTTVRSNIAIRGNNNLTSLNGLESLNTITSKLEISNNVSLRSIQGLSNLNLLSSLDILTNISLAECEVQSLCNLIDGDLGIPTNINGNGLGCESVSAITSACSSGELATSFAVQILDAFDKPVEGVSLTAKSSDGISSMIGISDPDGLVSFDLPNDEIQSFEGLTLSYEEPTNTSVLGVSVIDLVAVQNHILGLRPLTNPYAILAADTNGNGAVSASDLVFMINVIIGNRSAFANDKIYRIVDEDCVNGNSNCSTTPLLKNPGNQNQIKLRAIRIGDING